MRQAFWSWVAYAGARSGWRALWRVGMRRYILAVRRAAAGGRR